MEHLFQVPRSTMRQFLTDNGYNSKDIGFDFRNWIKALTSMSSGSNEDMLSTYLRSLGYTGSLSDKIYLWLLGQTGIATRPESDNAYFYVILPRLQAFGNLTFFKDFTALPVGEVTSAQLAADYAGGTATATFTSARSASNPASYITEAGILVPSTTADRGLITGGYYDATGFHAKKGLMIEAAGTNLSKDSYFSQTFSTYWRGVGGTASQSTEVSNVFGGGSVGKFVSTAQNGGLINSLTAKISFVSETTYTVWALVSGSGTAKAGFAIDGYSAHYGDVITLSSSPRLVSVTTVADASQVGNFGVYANDGSTTFYVHFIQVETNPYPTSYIPTTTAALYRPADVLKYPTSGNRTAATESIFIGYVPLGGDFANDGTSRFLLSSDTKDRRLQKHITLDPTKLAFYPNATDSSASRVVSTSSPTAGNKHVSSAIAVSATEDPNSKIYLNYSEEVTSNLNWISPLWGTYFYIGSYHDGTIQLNGILTSVTFYSDAKDATAVSKISALLA